MTMLKFTLPIVPTAQARVKVAVRGKFAQAYKTAGQKANERTLEACLLRHVPDKPMTGPLRLDFVAYLPVPRSDSKKAREGKLSGEILPTKKPDLDNVCKNLLDCMTRLQFWHDDAQLVILTCRKSYAASGFWAVAVRELGIEEIA